MNHCMECGSEISTPKFCNRSCSAKYYNKLPRKRLERQGKCKACHKIIQSSRMYCSKECRHSIERAITDEPCGNHTCDKNRLANSRYCSSRCSNIHSTVVTRYRLRDEYIAYGGGCCQHCGYNKCKGALEFHHLDRATKEFSMGAQSISMEKAKPELDKCILLCTNCHRTEEARLVEQNRAQRVKLGGCELINCSNDPKHKRFCSRKCNIKHNAALRRKVLKEQSIAYKGGCCSLCGYNATSEALDFHHRKDEQKEFTIAFACARGYAWSRVLPELDKCELVCGNCHREIHEKLTGGDSNS